MDKFKHKKKFGQSFLKDNSIPQKIVSHLHVNENDLIIEIGPGKGILTKELKKLGCNLICYEIDEEVLPYIKSLEDSKTKIILGDFLQVDLNTLPFKYDNLYIVANIPYYITTPIIEKIIRSNINVKEIVLMVQKEVADRLTAKPCTKAYGALTVYINYYYEVFKLFDVSRNFFIPKPNVDSTVIRFVKNNTKYDVDEKALYKIIKNSFIHKRKNIRNNLIDYDMNELEKILNKYNKTINSRAEELPLEAFIDITNNVKKIER